MRGGVPSTTEGSILMILWTASAFCSGVERSKSPTFLARTSRIFSNSSPAFFASSSEASLFPSVFIVLLNRSLRRGLFFNSFAAPAPWLSVIAFPPNGPFPVLMFSHIRSGLIFSPYSIAVRGRALRCAPNFFIPTLLPPPIFWRTVPTTPSAPPFPWSALPARPSPPWTLPKAATPYPNPRAGAAAPTP